MPVGLAADRMEIADLGSQGSRTTAAPALSDPGPREAAAHSLEPGMKNDPPNSAIPRAQPFARSRATLLLIGPVAAVVSMDKLRRMTAPSRIPAFDRGDRYARKPQAQGVLAFES